MTIHITWHAAWTVGKYLLSFGAGFVSCWLWQQWAMFRAWDGSAF